MRRTFLSVLLSLVLWAAWPAPVYAQQAPVTEESAQFLFSGHETVVEADGENGPWFYESDTLSVEVTHDSYGGEGYYIADIRLRRGERLFGGFAGQTPPGRGTEMPYLIARRYQAVLGFTGDFLCHYANPKGAMIRDGKVYYDESDADMLAVFEDGSMDVFAAGSINADGLLDRGAVDVFAFGPIILQEGTFYPPAGSHRLFPGNYRTGIGRVEDGHYLAIVTTGSFTLRQFAQLFADYHCTWAYNLDGGHSATMVFMGEQLNSHGYLEEIGVYQRPLPDLIMVGRSDEVPQPEGPVRYRGNR